MIDTAKAVIQKITLEDTLTCHKKENFQTQEPSPSVISFCELNYFIGLLFLIIEQVWLSVFMLSVILHYKKDH